MLPSEMPISRNEQKPFRNDQIEHETLRQEFEEPQIQFAIWCVFKSRSEQTPTRASGHSPNVTIAFWMRRGTSYPSTF